MIDVDPVRQVAADVANAIDEQLDAHDGIAFVRSVAVLVEVDLGNTTCAFHRFSDDRMWVQVAMLDEFAAQIDRLRQQRMNDVDAG